LFAVLSILGLLALGGFDAAQAADCSGDWRVIPNYKPGSGGPCAQLGLNSNGGTCLPGERYETLCDDASEGRYRTCPGPRRCDRDDDDHHDRRDRHDSYRPPYYDDRRRDNDPCHYWDYLYNAPCPDGYYNEDCRGPCEGGGSHRRRR
jgi:hypothetical protein